MFTIGLVVAFEATGALLFHVYCEHEVSQGLQLFHNVCAVDILGAYTANHRDIMIKGYRNREFTVRPHADGLGPGSMDGSG